MEDHPWYSGIELSHFLKTFGTRVDCKRCLPNFRVREKSELPLGFARYEAELDRVSRLVVTVCEPAPVTYEIGKDWDVGCHLPIFLMKALASRKRRLTKLQISTQVRW
jgi:hypothetical protein